MTNKSPDSSTLWSALHSLMIGNVLINIHNNINIIKWDVEWIKMNKVLHIVPVECLRGRSSSEGGGWALALDRGVIQSYGVGDEGSPVPLCAAQERGREGGSHCPWWPASCPACVSPPQTPMCPRSYQAMNQPFWPACPAAWRPCAQVPISPGATHLGHYNNGGLFGFGQVQNFWIRFLSLDKSWTLSCAPLSALGCVGASCLDWYVTVWTAASLSNVRVELRFVATAICYVDYTDRPAKWTRDISRLVAVLILHFQTKCNIFKSSIVMLIITFNVWKM